MAKPEIKNIDPDAIKWIDRPSERKEVPEKYFLMPSERKFPYRNKDGSLNCRLVRAAIVRAAQHGYPEVEKKARKIYEKFCSKEKQEKSEKDFVIKAEELLKWSFMTGLHPEEILRSLDLI